MSNNVFANGREIACKSGSGKVIAAFPDVCFTPPDKVPPTPPGVPIPYPLFSKAADTEKGSKKVTISGKEVMKRDSSDFKKCMGDEAAKTAKKGIINSKLTGKVYFTSWSMDVKVEGKNVVRHLDTTTSNHSSPNANAAVPCPYLDTGAFDSAKECKEDKKKEEQACEKYKPKGKKDACKDAGLNEQIPNSDAAAIGMGYQSKTDFGNQKAKKANAKNKAAKCIQARRCRLVPYSPRANESKCCPSQTGDHIIPKSSFFSDKYGGSPMPGWQDYNQGRAPVMCLEGGGTSGSHGIRHTFHKSMSSVEANELVGFNKELKFCAESARYAAPHCSSECLEKQLSNGHSGMGDKRKKIRHSPTGSEATDSQLDSMDVFTESTRD
ncbi:PAAR-like domain-containing protein [Bowmanella yangjiangensis]|uniref:DUF4150 domain-containing protein n=1 Tax=Bowmanella yangjiangensis TaxID=2811230 RepID=A0ABS3CYJ2_9ALTE|nr:PAAR-like domain-containing protein [Bowmanella yangjiangensis]MBN7821640.1 DUF4150 domain-containing protein [Bowmanella yangjiangensis]